MAHAGLKLAVVFGAVQVLAGCGFLHMPPQAPPETRTRDQMREEARKRFREAGFEVMDRGDVLPIPHLGITDVSYTVQKDGSKWHGLVLCKPKMPCKLFEVREIPRERPAP